MCSCDFDPPSCYQEQTRRARKGHTCCECGSPIRPGETYRHVSGVWDGTPDSFKQCALCARVCDAWQAFAREHRAELECGDPCWAFGQLWESIAEWLREEEEHRAWLIRERTRRERMQSVVMGEASR